MARDNTKIESLFSVAGEGLVTGGSRGIGEMIAAGFLANGANYISSRKVAACDVTASHLTDRFGGEGISLPTDVAQLAGVDGPSMESSA